MNWGNYSTDELRELYSLANTGGFIYQQFRANAVVQAIAKTYSSEQIVAELERLLATDTSLDMVVKAYACIAALSLLDQDAAERLSELDLSKLRWAGTLVTLMRSRAIRTTVTREVFNALTVTREIQSPAATSRTVIPAG